MHLTQERGHRWGLCQMQDEGRQNNLHAAQQCKLKCRLTGEWLQCPERHRAGFLQKANLQIGWEGEGVGFARVQKKSQKQALQPDLRQISGGNKSLRAFRSIIGTESHQMGAGKGECEDVRSGYTARFQCQLWVTLIYRDLGRQN